MLCISGFEGHRKSNHNGSKIVQLGETEFFDRPVSENPVSWRAARENPGENPGSINFESDLLS